MDNQVEAVDRGGENWITLTMMDKGLYAYYLSCASVVGSMMSHPFFVITTQNQIGKHVTLKDSKATNASLFSAASKIGMRGLFHGAAVSQVFNVPASVVYLWVTEHTREASRDFLFSSFPKLSVGAVDAIQVTYSALFANVTSMAVCYPANLIVTKMVVQDRAHRLSFINTCKSVYKEHGAHGFTHGFFSNFVYNTTVSVSWWYAYGYSRRMFTKLIPDIGKDEVYIDGLSGFTAGIFSTFLAHPLDSICARIMTGQSKTRCISGTAREIVAAEGAMVLWRGLFPSMMGTVVSSTIFALAYEYIKRASTAE